MEKVFCFHQMDGGQCEQFFLDALRDYMKDSKRDNRALVDFLGVCLERGGRNLIRELTKLVKKLNKGRQEELNEAMEEVWGAEGSLMALWQDVMEEVQSPSAFQERMAGLFRRKNKDRD